MKPDRTKTFDVRPLIARGEEPLTAIRARVANLDTGQSLTVLAPFMPAPLVELLKSEGYASTLEHRADGAWAVTFRRS
jgi:uncharacterized protein (DUF2249 family)